VFHHWPSLGDVVEINPYRPTTPFTIVSPPRTSRRGKAQPRLP
jgi:hypothetical protein